MMIPPGALAVTIRNAAGHAMVLAVDVRPADVFPRDDLTPRCEAMVAAGARCIIVVRPPDVTRWSRSAAVDASNVDQLAAWVAAWEGVYLFGQYADEPAPCVPVMVRAALAGAPVLRGQVAAGISELQNRHKYAHN